MTEPTERAAQQSQREGAQSAGAASPETQGGQVTAPAVAARPQDESRFDFKRLNEELRTPLSAVKHHELMQEAFTRLAILTTGSRPQAADFEVMRRALSAAIADAQLWMKQASTNAERLASPQEAAPQGAMRERLAEWKRATEEDEYAPDEAANIAYELITELLAASPAGQWVSVHERLPEGDDIRVVAMNSAGYATCVTHIWDSKTSGGFVGEDATAEQVTLPIGNITHWMPLPASPEPRKP